MTGIQDECYLPDLFLKRQFPYEPFCLKDKNIIYSLLYLIVKQSIIRCQGTHFRCPVCFSFLHIPCIKPELGASIAKRMPEFVRPGGYMLFAQVLPQEIADSCIKVCHN